MPRMTMTHAPAAISPHVREPRTASLLLLACGLFSSLLYVAADLVGGTRYPGYDFTAQAISELGAVGAPSKSIADPMFLGYNVFVLLFAVGVLREAARRGRALGPAGGLLLLYGAVGLPGVFFSMQPRGAGSLETDLPHLVLTGVLVVLMLLAMGFGGFALGWRFRRYSLATIALVIAFGAWAGTYAARVAANLPTPGLGIVERVVVYAWLLWVAVLSVALLRRPRVALEEVVP